MRQVGDGLEERPARLERRPRELPQLVVRAAHVRRVEHERIRGERIDLAVVGDDVARRLPRRPVEQKRVLAIAHEDVALGDDLHRAVGLVDSEVERAVVEVVAPLARRARRRRDPDAVREAHLRSPVARREVRLVVRRGHRLRRTGMRSCGRRGASCGEDCVVEVRRRQRVRKGRQVRADAIEQREQAAGAPGVRRRRRRRSHRRRAARSVRRARASLAASGSCERRAARPRRGPRAPRAGRAPSAGSSRRRGAGRPRARPAASRGTVAGKSSSSRRSRAALRARAPRGPRASRGRSAAGR